KAVLSLSGGATVWIHDDGRGSVALRIEGQVEECTDDLSVEALVMHKLRCGDVLRIQTGDGVMGKLPRLITGDVIDPYIDGRVRGLMGDQQLTSIGREFLLMRNSVDPFGHGEFLALQ